MIRRLAIWLPLAVCAWVMVLPVVLYVLGVLA